MGVASVKMATQSVIKLETPGTFTTCGSEAVPTPGAGQVLVRSGAVGMCGTDYHAYDGNQNFFTYPRVLGHELGVTVVSFGDDETAAASGLKVDDKCAVVPYWECGKCVSCKWGKPNCCTDISVIGVHADGGMQPFFVVPANKLVKSDKLPLETLALVETLCIGAHAVFRGTPRQGENCLVIGAGPVGMGTAQFAQAEGCKVVVMDINNDRLAFIRESVGIEHTINARGEGEDAPDAVLARLFDNELPTLVFEATGNIHSMKNSFNYVAHGGKLVFVGHTKEKIEFDNPLFHSHEMTLIASRNALAQDFARTISLIEDGKVNVDPWITHRSSLADFEQNFLTWKDPASGCIKGIVTME